MANLINFNRKPAMGDHCRGFWKWAIFFVLVCIAARPLAQSPAYDRAETFEAAAGYGAGGAARAIDGSPGPVYWQNSADYVIAASIDTGLNRITGTVTVNYTNNSPNRLNYLWLQLDQNIKKRESRYVNASMLASLPFHGGDFTGGFEIGKVSVTSQGKVLPADYIVEDSRMQLRLSAPVKANGGTIRISVDYSFTIPANGAGRMGITRTKKGKIFQVAQWYPRMSVYDDAQGWNTVPYQMGAEFYLPYGNFDYSVTAPANMLVVGSGDLRNEREVLGAAELKNLALARGSDSTVMICSTLQGAMAKGTRTWKFRCARARDVAWVASSDFVWDAARINLPGGRRALAMSVYPDESATADGWKRSTAFVKAAVEIYAQKWYPYPYAAAVNIAGNVDGMEYPGMAFSAKDATGGSLWEITAHEMGHQWFPMLVGSNERKYAWMDEGLTTFITSLATREFNRGEYYLPFTDSVPSYLVQRYFSKEAVPVMSSPMLGSESEIYSKPALALKLLRNEVLGPERFDYAFRDYIRNWAFRHPVPMDFFHSMENAAGEDLGWFWNSWFLHTWKLDQSVESVKYVDTSDIGKGVMITIANLEKMVMPVTIKITGTDGSSELVKVPVEAWQKGGRWAFWHPCRVQIREVLVDPDRQLPDINRVNNLWKNGK